MLHTTRPNKGSTKKRFRVARGPGSGAGTTAGRGTKGQQSRAGKGRRLGFEGGQTPMIRRQPKIGGFLSPRRVENEVINLQDMEKKLPAGSYDIAALKKMRIVSSNRPVKLLGKGTVTKKYTLTIHAASKSAVEAISKAGGSVTFVNH